MKENLVIVLSLDDSDTIISQDEVFSLVLHAFKLFVAFNPENHVSIILNQSYLLPTFDQDLGSYIKYPRIKAKFRKVLKKRFREDSSIIKNLGKSLTMAVCRLNKIKEASFTGRVLIVQNSKSSTSQAISTLNATFSANNHAIAIDALDLSSHHSGCPILRKITALSNGLYYHPVKIHKNTDMKSALVSTLSNFFMLPLKLRQDILIPKSLRAENYADINQTICFCHNTFVDQGFICSSCLAIYCSYASVCQMCQTPVADRISLKSKNAALKD